MQFNIDGFKVLDILFQEDKRGNFQKIFNKDYFDSLGIDFVINESYISNSKINSLRGMHFQKEPYSHDKLVACVHGRALDVCIDLRKDSRTFGEIDYLNLEPGINAVFIPKGVAHGFFALEDNTIITYYTSTVYNPDYDSGIHWDSIGFKWPTKHPIVSDRDSNHPRFKEIK